MAQQRNEPVLPQAGHARTIISSTKQSPKITTSRRSLIGIASVITIISCAPFMLTNSMTELSVLDDLHQTSSLKSHPDKSSSTNALPKTIHSISDFHRAAIAPIPAYTDHLAQEAIRPSEWQCSSAPQPVHQQNHTILSFVHIYKTAGTTMRQFFHEYSYTCHKTWMSLARCTNTESSIEKGSKWKSCLIEEVADGRHGVKEHIMSKMKHRKYNKVNNRVLRDSVDVFGGHVRIGSGDWIFPSDSNSNFTSSQSSQLSATPSSPRVRYIVFLRDPMERYVSGRLYQNKVNEKKLSFEQVVNEIKTALVDNRGSYFTKSFSYLLSPSQEEESKHLNAMQLMETIAQSTAKETETMTLSQSALIAETRAKVVIRNLIKYNAIIGMTERMTESMHILKHVLLHNPHDDIREAAEQVFRKFTPEPERLNIVPDNSTETIKANNKGGVQANVSKGGMSTSAVMEELAKDEEIMKLFREFVKYEQMITDFAWSMHNMQYEAVVRATA